MWCWKVSCPGERRPASAGGMGEAGSAVEMGRLKAPVRDKPGIDQHQRRALRPDLRDMGSDIKKCTAAGRLRVTQRCLNRWAVTDSAALRNP